MASAAKLRVQMRTVEHVADETEAGAIFCECGMVAKSRDDLARRHQRGRTLPGVFEMKEG